jgi:predicted RNA binding protein YcfA (HicA-like mRNA interferase family)
MPRIPVASGRDIVKALRRLGFEEVRQRGSHVIMRRGSYGCAVPLHPTVKRGTFATIVKQAGIAPEELIEALRR